jgi:DNA-binding GntR family transcriptional regulator
VVSTRRRSASSERARLQFDIDKSSPVPLYSQIADQLEEAINDGTLAPGQSLESEVALAGRLSVSRPTLRQAVERLVEKGLIVRRRGVGTVVVGRQMKRSVALSSLFDDLRVAGHHPSTDVLSLDVVPADATVARALACDPATPVVFVSRLRYSDGMPLGILENHLPDGLIELSVEMLEKRGLYEVMRSCSLQPQVAEQTIGARAPTQVETTLLRIPRGVPVLTMARTAFDSSGRPVEFGNHCYRADLYSFELSLVAR